MNIFLYWLSQKNLSGWYFITLEFIFNFRENDITLSEYLSKLNPMTSNPFVKQEENNTWLLVNETMINPVFPIDWCEISEKWEIYKKENNI